MSNPIVRRLLTLLLGVLILLYVGYQVIVSSYVSVETETAEYATLADVYTTQAYVVRNEEIITGETGGYIVDYPLEDGGKVSKGGVVAQLYREGSSVGIQDQVERLETEVALLQRLNNAATSYAADPTVLRRLAGESVAELLAAATAGDFSSEGSQRSDVLFRLNQLALVTQEDFDYSARLASLQAELASLKASVTGSVGEIRSASSGFFSRSVDGYENAFSYDDIENITVEALQSDVQPESIPDNAVGKVTTQHEWYIVCVMDAETVLKLSGKDTVKVTMPFVSSTPVEAEIVAINQETYESDAAVVLCCSTVSGEYINARHETVEIELKSYAGVMVRQDAIRFEDVTEVVENEDGTTREVLHENVKGVYVLVGSRLEFVQIFSEVSANGYVVCKTELSDNDVLLTEHTLRLYDKVVVKGSDLYDGKIL